MIEVKELYKSFRERSVLTDINFSVSHGQSVAIVGKSGAGKTTFIDLIPRYFSVNKGEVLFDDINVDNIDVFSLRQQIGIVSQDNLLFNDTIYNNIPEGSVILTNRRSTIKYINPLFGNHIIKELRGITNTSIRNILERHDELYIVLHERLDSDFWHQKNLENEKIVRLLYSNPVLLVDEKISNEDKLLIWHIKKG